MMRVDFDLQARTLLITADEPTLQYLRKMITEAVRRGRSEIRTFDQGDQAVEVKFLKTEPKE